jgi:hypothetical protein
LVGYKAEGDFEAAQQQCAAQCYPMFGQDHTYCDTMSPLAPYSCDELAQSQDNFSQAGYCQ